MKNNMVYIIILVWNGKKYLSKLFSSLANLDYPKDKYKILVLDSGSTDGSRDYLRDLNDRQIIKLIELKKNLGFTGGNNLGMQHALKNKAKYIFLLNQDTFVKPDFLTELIKTAETDKKIGIVQSLTMHYNNPDKIQSLGNQLHYLGYGWSGGNWLPQDTPKFENEAKKMVYASGAAVLYTAQMLNEIGLFDENFFAYHEDSDICLRAKLRGYKVVLAPKSIVYHDYDFAPDKNKLRYYWNERNRIYLILKNYSCKTILLIIPMMLAMDLGQLIFAIKKGYTWEWLKARLWIKFNLYKVLKVRHLVQKNRQISDKELMHNFASEIKYQSVKKFLLDKIGNPILKAYWNLIKKII